LLAWLAIFWRAWIAALIAAVVGSPNAGAIA
jgi:hypothetical protein